MFPDATPDELNIVVDDLIQISVEDEFSARSPGREVPFEPGLRNLQTITNATDKLAGALPIIGGVAGAPGGLGTSVVGAAAGGALEKVLKTGGEKRDLVDIARAARDEGAFEAIGGAAFNATLGAGARLLRGSKTVSDRFREAFAEFGHKPSLQEVSDTSIVEGGRSIMGAIPIFSTPFKKFQAKRLVQANQALDDFVRAASPDTIALRAMAESNPIGARILNEKMSKSLLEGLGLGWDFLKGQKDIAHQALRDGLKAVEGIRQFVGRPLVSKGKNIFNRLGKVLDDESIRSFRLKDGAKLENTKELEIVSKFLDDVSKIPDDLSFNTLAALKKRIAGKIDELSDSPTAVKLLTRLKEGVEEDIDQLFRSEPALAALYKEAKAFDEEFFALLGEISGRTTRSFNTKLGRQRLQEVVTEGGDTLFKNAGAKDLVRMMDALADSTSPSMIRQFSKVLKGGVGEVRTREMLGDALGRKLSRIIDKAFKVTREKSEANLFEPGTILRNMGLSDPTSGEFAATVQLFESSGIDPKRMFKLITLLDGMFSAKVGKAAQMLQRRVGLSGIQGVVRGILPGVAIGGGVAGGTAAAAAGGGLLGGGGAALLVTFIVGRSIGKTLTSPRRAAAVFAIADSTLPNNARGRAFASILTDPDFLGAADVVGGINSGANKLFDYLGRLDVGKETKEVLGLLKTEKGRNALFDAIDKDLEEILPKKSVKTRLPPSTRETGRIGKPDPKFDRRDFSTNAPEF